MVSDSAFSVKESVLGLEVSVIGVGVNDDFFVNLKLWIVSR